jgi:hypothetical protein
MLHDWPQHEEGMKSLAKQWASQKSEIP